jgi:hypothetical protein
MGNEKINDDTSIPDGVMGINEFTVYDPDSDTQGRGFGWSPEEAVEQARIDLEAQKVADQAEQKREEKEISGCFSFNKGLPKKYLWTSESGVPR